MIRYGTQCSQRKGKEIIVPDKNIYLSVKTMSQVCQDLLEFCVHLMSAINQKTMKYTHVLVPVY